MTGFAEPCLLFTRPDLASETIANFDGKMANTVEYIIKVSRHTSNDEFDFTAEKK